MHQRTFGQQLRIVLPTVFFTLILSTSCITPDRGTPPPQLSPAMQCEFPSQRYAWSPAHSPKLVWLSLDSLNQVGLEDIISQLRNPHPRGLKWILQLQNKNPLLTVHEPTITSSSHISTITCSTAGTHGIFANSQWNGTKMVSGFDARFATETFATTLKNAGLKVVTAAYPSLDNSESGRLVSEGFSYGESLGRSQIQSLKHDKPLTHAWKDSEGGLIEELTFKGKEISEIQHFSCLKNKCIFEKSATTGLIDVTVLTPKQSLRAFIQPLPGVAPQVYISALSSNKAFPEELRKKFDACGAIFSPGKDHALASFGAEHLIRGFEHRLGHFDWNWAHYLPSTKADVLFLYLEDIDALRHQYAGDLQSREVVARHYERVDAVVGNFFAALPASTNVVVMGDHGMSTISKDLNVRKMIPLQAVTESHIVTSGGTLMLYGNRSQAKDLAALPDENELTWLLQTQKNLSNFKLPGSTEHVFSKVFIKGTDAMKSAGLNHKNAPFLIAFARENYGLQNAVTDELVLGDSADPKKPAPRPRGQHGHARESAQMKTFLTGWGSMIDTIRLGEVKSNIDLVPTLGKAFSWQIPPQCRSK
ncbi:MAG: alkaline phosphatase family protein [Betaproteobacteria bacterium]|nr:alkaline phosphatase family protein [Betaproteobacteria bacterium]